MESCVAKVNVTHFVAYHKCRHSDLKYSDNSLGLGAKILYSAERWREPGNILRTLLRICPAQHFGVNREAPISKPYGQNLQILSSGDIIESCD